MTKMAQEQLGHLLTWEWTVHQHRLLEVLESLETLQYVPVCAALLIQLKSGGDYGGGPVQLSARDLVSPSEAVNSHPPCCPPC